MSEGTKEIDENDIHVDYFFGNLNYKIFYDGTKDDIFNKIEYLDESLLLHDNDKEELISFLKTHEEFIYQNHILKYWTFSFINRKNILGGLLNINSYISEESYEENKKKDNENNQKNIERRNSFYSVLCFICLILLIVFIFMIFYCYIYEINPFYYNNTYIHF